MASPFFTDNDVPLEFDTFDGTTALNPTSASVDIFDHAGTKVITAAAVTLSDNNIKYTVDKSNTAKAGKYRGEFNLVLPGAIDRTHIIIFDILERT